MVWWWRAKRTANEHLVDKLEAAMRLTFLFDHLGELDVAEIQVELADIITLLTATVKEI
jgi:hypothetical protein